LQKKIKRLNEQLNQLELRNQKIEIVPESDDLNCSNNKTKISSKIGRSFSHHQEQENEKRWEREVTYFLSHPELKKLIRLTKTQFNKLLSIVKGYLDRYIVKGKPRSNQVYNIRNWKTRIFYSTHLFITLYWLRNYPTNAILAAQFGLDKRDVTLILNRTLMAKLLSVFESPLILRCRFQFHQQ
jgi:hypothetical protein